MISGLYYRALQLSGITAFARSIRAGGTVFCYHNVVADGAGDTDRARGGDPAIHLAASAFARQCAWIQSHYTVIPLAEMVARLRSGRPPRGTASITFDDAYAGVFTHALPLLRALALPATVFVPTTCVDRGTPFWWDHPTIVSTITSERRERWLGALRGDADTILAQEGANLPAALPPSHLPASWTTIAAAARDGWAFGAHSATHRALTQLSDAELTAEVDGSRAALEQRTGFQAEHFAYPYGGWNARVAECVRAAGFAAGLTLDAGFSTRGLDPMAMPRVNIPASISDPAFAAWAAGLRPSRSRA